MLRGIGNPERAAVYGLYRLMMAGRFLQWRRWIAAFTSQAPANHAAALLFILAFAVAVVSAWGFVSGRNRAERLEAVSLLAEVLLSHVKDAETGQRGYLLTGRTRYLEPYTAVLDAIQTDLEMLREAVAPEPVLAEPYVHLSRLVPLKLDELARTIGLAQAGQPEAAVGIVATDEGRAIMIALRAQGAALRTTAEAERKRLQMAERLRLLLASSGALGLSLVAGAVLLLSARASHRRRTASEARLSLAEAAAAVGLWERDLLRPGTATFSPTLLELYGISPDEPAARRFGPAAWADMLHPDDRPQAEATLRDAVETGRPFEMEFRIRRASTGQVRWILRRGRRQDGPDGRPRLLVGADLDITERKAAGARQSALAHELDHRVKNTLATVQALAAQTLSVTSQEPARFAKDFSGRLQALARAHNLLNAGAWQGATIGLVVRAGLAPWLGSGTRIALAGEDDIAVGRHQAQALVLALHELATNAVKHGALTQAEGQVAVRWSRERLESGDEAVTLCWVETGGPRLAGAPTRRGFGARLLMRGTAHDLGTGASVELRYEPEGLRVIIRLMATPAAAPVHQPVQASVKTPTSDY